MNGYKILENNLIDIIKEEQAKLGYRKEKIRLYYPLSSLNNMFSSQDNVYEMAERLKKLSEYTNETLGEINVSNKADRFCFYISEQGVEYVHNNTKEDEFIKKLIELVGKHETKMQDIENLFLSKSSKVHIEKMEDNEFYTLIYFEEDSEDTYYYCFKDEGFHIIYHRFLPDDYKDMYQ